MKSLYKLFFLISLGIAVLFSMILFFKSTGANSLYLLVIFTVVFYGLSIFFLFYYHHNIIENFKEETEALKKEITILIKGEDKSDEERIIEQARLQQEKVIAKIVLLKSDLVNSLQGANSSEEASKSLQNLLVKEFELIQSQFYGLNKLATPANLKLVTSFAYYNNNETIPIYEFGEGLIGQVAIRKELLRVEDIPEGYINVVSGLGKSAKSHLVIAPILNKEKETRGILEMASFKEFPDYTEQIIKEITLEFSNQLELLKLN